MLKKYIALRTELINFSQKKCIKILPVTFPTLQNKINKDNVKIELPQQGLIIWSINVTSVLHTVPKCLQCFLLSTEF